MKNRDFIEDDSYIIHYQNEVNLMISTVCNFKCSFCSVQSSKDRSKYEKKFMDLETIKKITDLYKNRYFTIGSREPFIHPDIEKLILIIIENNNIRIRTNGSLVMKHDKYFNSLSKDQTKKIDFVISYNMNIKEQLSSIYNIDINENTLNIFNMTSILGMKFHLAGLQSEDLIENNSQFFIDNFGLENYNHYRTSKCPKMDKNNIDDWSKYVSLTGKQYYDINGSGPLNHLQKILRMNGIYKDNFEDLTEEEKNLL